MIPAGIAASPEEIGRFPFVEPPDARNIRDGVALLHELGAFDPDAPNPRRRLTKIGRLIARIPADPRLARLVVEAARRGVLEEVIVDRKSTRLNSSHVAMSYAVFRVKTRPAS